MIKRIFCILFFGFISVTSSVVANSQVVDRIILIIDQDVVMLSELKQKAQENFSDLRQKKINPMPSKEQILNRSLNQLIEEKLLLAEANRQGITADERLVSQNITNIAKKNNLNLTQLKAALIADGKDFKKFQTDIYNQIVIQRILKKEVVNKINVSDSEINQYLSLQDSAPSKKKSVKLFHILIKIPKNSSANEIKELKNKALLIRSKINEGESFKKLAQKFSDGEKAMSGGELDWLNIASLPIGFSDLVEKMKINEVKGPFRGEFGFHIIKLKSFRENIKNKKIIERANASHILIRTNESISNDEAKTRLIKLKDRIISGDKFSNLASANSNDQASAINGGNLGWISPGQMVPEFEQVLNNTKTGEISDPFKTRFGWHILIVHSRETHDATEKIQRDMARKEIRNKKVNEATNLYKQKLRGEAYLEMRLNNIK